MHAFVGASEQREAALAVCLTHLFAAVVTSERSHEVCVRCMLLWELPSSARLR